MKKVYKKYPESFLTGYIYCESIMCLNPWDLWH